MSGKTYRCAVCGEEFEGAWTDEEATAEFRENFGPSVSLEDADVVCDDCWQKIDPQFHQAEAEQAVADELRQRDPNQTEDTPRAER